jgi:hypothetical protein
MKNGASSMNRKDVPGTTWLLVGLAVLVTIGGLIALTSGASQPSGDSIVALLTGVFGVVGTHIGHVTGHLQGLDRGDHSAREAAADADPPPAGSSRDAADPLA